MFVTLGYGRNSTNGIHIRFICDEYLVPKFGTTDNERKMQVDFESL